MTAPTGREIRRRALLVRSDQSASPDETVAFWRVGVEDALDWVATGELCESLRSAGRRAEPAYRFPASSRRGTPQRRSTMAAYEAFKTVPEPNVTDDGIRSALRWVLTGEVTAAVGAAFASADRYNAAANHL